MKEVKATDILFNTAEAVVELAKTMGMEVKMTDLYSKKAKELAFIAESMRSLIEEVTGISVTIINDIP